MVDLLERSWIESYIERVLFFDGLVDLLERSWIESVLLYLVRAHISASTSVIGRELKE